MTGDPLAEALRARGFSQDLIDLIVERAAILQYEAGKTRWKAGVEAQRMHLGDVLVKNCV